MKRPVDQFIVQCSEGKLLSIKFVFDERTYEILADDLIANDASVDEVFEHAERMMLKWTERCLALRPDYDAPRESWPLSDEDLIITTWPTGPPRGGQHVGCPTGVFVWHKPTGVGVIRDEERSQLKNKLAALEVLRKILLRY